MTPERIAELRALCEAATPGEYHVDGGRTIWRGRWRTDGQQHPVATWPGEPMEAPPVGTAATLELMAAAPTALPEALTEIERLRAVIAKMEEDADAARWHDAEMAEMEADER